MRNPLIIGIIMIGVISCSGSSSKGPTNSKGPTRNLQKIQKDLNQKSLELEQYIQGHPQFNNEIVFLIDMSIFSGYNRFFVYNLKSKIIIKESLVAHGKGSDDVRPELMGFSNKEGSYCTSLGKYKIAESYIGDYGKAYKLYGLDPTNSNAYDRAIVLHKYTSVPDREQTKPICLSLGCPMVSPNFFTYLERIIDNSRKNILLYIYSE